MSKKKYYGKSTWSAAKTSCSSNSIVMFFCKLLKFIGKLCAAYLFLALWVNADVIKEVIGPMIGL